MKRKIIIAAVAALLTAVPAFAVFNEKNLGQTLSVLRFELKQELDKREGSKGNIDRKDFSQHGRMISMMKKCNELSLMLYSQNQDCTFDMTYALKEVTKQYEEFNDRKLPFDDIVGRLDIEIDRYSRLVESLRRLPPQLREVEDLPDSLAYHNDSLKVDFPVMPRRRMVLDSLNANGHKSAFFLDSEGQADRDSCLHYATTLLKMYSDIKDRIIADNEHYDDASARLKESYDYAQSRYKVLQKRMFVQSQDNYIQVLLTLPSYARRAFEDAANKYGRRDAFGDEIAGSEWRGPIVTGFMLLVVLCLVLSTLLSVGVFSVLRRHTRLIKSDMLKHRWRALTMFFGVVIFAITVSIARLTVDHNFFIVASELLLILAWLIAAILLSIIIRLGDDSIHGTLKLFLPVMTVGVLVVTFRIIFIPNRLMNLFFPPLLLAIFFWQLVACRRNRGLEKSDMVISWISLCVFFVTTVMAWAGYVFLSVQIVIWWLFQIAAIETVTAVYDLLRMYRDNRLKTRLDNYKSQMTVSGPKATKGEYIRVTWLYDAIEMMVVPVMAILSVPFSITLALDVFDLSEICHTILYSTFFDLKNTDGEEILRLSLNMIVLASSLFFVFKYLNYLIRSFYRELKFDKLRKTAGKAHIHTNEVNLTLANNVISILVWGTYIIMTVILLKIPTGAVSIIAAGLATGIGLAMKDILNNFIYGIQLMSGRLRVGDWVECDGVRGKVTDISYQSTQIETVDGAVMSFLNTSLFNKNFKNLTRNNEYEFVKIIVGVNYGADVDKVRGLILDALKPIQTKDKYRRDIVDHSRGVTVAFEEFGESSVDIAVKQYVLVPERAGYIANAKEAIYKTLGENGIEIPFPQRDIHLRKD